MSVKILSIRQPWAWLIVNGWKNIENRDWPTKYRGKFLVHASKGMTLSEYSAACLFIRGFSWGAELFRKIPLPGELPKGGIVGEATLLDCVTQHESEWFTGEYGFVLADQREMPFQPMKGRLGFFMEKDEVKS